MLLDFLFDAFLEEYFDQRLVGYIALVRHRAQFVQHHAREAQRDRLRGWLQLMSSIRGKDERCIEEDLLTLAINYLVEIPVLVTIPFVPLEADAACNDRIHDDISCHTLFRLTNDIRNSATPGSTRQAWPPPNASHARSPISTPPARIGASPDCSLSNFGINHGSMRRCVVAAHRLDWGKDAKRRPDQPIDVESVRSSRCTHAIFIYVYSLPCCC